MLNRLAAAALALTLPSAVPEPANATEYNPNQPATVVVAFDRDSVTPLIVKGVADREAQRAVEANDPVRIASISKLIMALATLRLVDEGKVELDADVSEYLGWPVRHPNFPDAKVTLAQLLSHRSGLRDNAGYVIPLGESLEAKLAEPEAWYGDAAPGEAPFEYANLGSPVVATVLEAATGERYDRLVERTVFAPLGVKACLNWVGCSEDMVSRAVVLYRDTGEIARDSADNLPPNCTVPVAEGTECDLDAYVPGTNASIFSPQGGVRIGMVDLAKIGQALMLEDERLIATDQLRAMQRSVREGDNSSGPDKQDFFCFYGYGIQAIEVFTANCQDALFQNGRMHVGHAGEAYGLRAGLWFWSADGMDHTVKFGQGFAYFTTAVPPRAGAEDEGGFSEREIALMAEAQERAQSLLAEKNTD